MARSQAVIPVVREMAVHIRPDEAFARLPPSQDGFLLESADGHGQYARWSYLCAGQDLPVLRLSREECTLRVGRTVRRVDASSPLEALRRALGGLAGARRPDLPRFFGGAVGYFSYDAVRWFERIPARHPPDTFPEGEWMLVDRLLAFDRRRPRALAVALARLDSEPSARAAFAVAKDRVDELCEGLWAGERPAPLPTPWVGQRRALWSREGFEGAVERAREYIRAGDAFQVVLSQRFDVPVKGSGLALYRALRRVNPSPYMFFLRFGGRRELVGSSPEILVRVAGKKVIVRPIAGTRRRGKTPREDVLLEKELLNDPKERAEHVMLVDLGRNDVGRVSRLGSVAVDAYAQVERYSHVMHIASEVSGRLADGKDALDAVAGAFPAGTVSGAPKIRAMEIIDELEPVARGPYAGAVGTIGSDGDMDVCIGIRTLVRDGDVVRVQAGAGIVADSQPAAEFEETLAKSRALFDALELAASGV